MKNHISSQDIFEQGGTRRLPKPYADLYGGSLSLLSDTVMLLAGGLQLDRDPRIALPCL